MLENTGVIILASTSSARRALMDGLGLPCQAVAPNIDEATSEPPERATVMLAERKARAVFQRYPDAIVIGSDQLVSLDGRALGKPTNAEAARSQLASLSGRTHEIMTAVCVLAKGHVAQELDTARLTVCKLSPEELDAYVATNEWQGCAGGYRVEGKGQALFEAIDGDRSAIQGLPMLRVVRMLRALGVRFW